MDKAEEKLRQHGIKPGVNITEEFFKLIMKCMDEYAQQVSRGKEEKAWWAGWKTGVDAAGGKVINSYRNFIEWQNQQQ